MIDYLLYKAPLISWIAFYWRYAQFVRGYRNGKEFVNAVGYTAAYYIWFHSKTGSGYDVGFELALGEAAAMTYGGTTTVELCEPGKPPRKIGRCDSYGVWRQL